MFRERRALAWELRADGRRLSGTVLTFGEVSPSHRERFEPGAFRFEAVPLNLEHDPLRAVAWQPGGGLSLTQDRQALRMEATLPPIPAADLALELVKTGRASGLSVEFRAVRERREAGLRVIEAAELTGVGIVRAPSYEQSRVEARRRSGRTIRARIPANKNLSCRCSGATCKLARLLDDGMREAFEEAFERAEREVIAGFGSYDMPLASVSNGTLRGRVLASGDGEVEIDLPDDANGIAVLAAHEAAGTIVRPHIDRDAAVSRIEGETRIYETMPLRAFLVSATDAREGWPAPEIIATPGELAHVDAPRRRRVWL